MPTPWEPYHESEQIHDFLELLLSNRLSLGASAVLEDDFKAIMGDPCEGASLMSGFGQRNDPGWMMAHWVARTGFLVGDNWIRRRAMDGQLVQLFTLTLIQYAEQRST